MDAGLVPRAFRGMRAHSEHAVFPAGRQLAVAYTSAGRWIAEGRAVEALDEAELAQVLLA
jgi:hypothetical protein